MIGLSHVVDDHFITLGRSAACPASPGLRISEEQKIKVFTPDAFLFCNYPFLVMSVYYYMQFGEFLWRTGKFCDVIERKLRKYSSLNIKIKFLATPFNNKIFQHIPALGRLDVQNSGIRQHYYPEGGWGWVVVLCTFLCNALTTGLLLSGAIAIVMAVRWYWYCCQVLLLLLLGAIAITIAIGVRCYCYCTPLSSDR